MIKLLSERVAQSSIARTPVFPCSLDILTSRTNNFLSFMSFCTLTRMHDLALILLALLLTVSAYPNYNTELYEGSRCKMEDGSDGKCIKLPNCPKRVREVKEHLRFPDSPGRCGFDGFIEIVCCPLSEVEGNPMQHPQTSGTPPSVVRLTSTSDQPILVATVTPSPSLTIPDPMANPDDPFNDPFANTDDIGSKLGIRPSDAACQLIEREIANKTAREVIQVNPWIFDGENATKGEFPHMVALGYRMNKQNTSSITYSCGGTLITLQYVLTAAHCVNNIYNKKPTEVKLGAVDLDDTSDNVQNIKVSQIISHPSYKRTLNYYDIAILKLERPAVSSTYVRPICLQTKPLPNLRSLASTPSLIVTGWGATSFEIDNSNTLQKTPNMRLIERLECAKSYKNSSKLPRGIDDSMICLKDKNETRRSDACQGDSGGPLILGNEGFGSVIGITSFGQFCGSIIPAVYTNVFFYLDWIEEVVWPDEKRSLRRT